MSNKERGSASKGYHWGQKRKREEEDGSDSHQREVGRQDPSLQRILEEAEAVQRGHGLAEGRRTTGIWSEGAATTQDTHLDVAKRLLTDHIKEQLHLGFIREVRGNPQ